MTSFTSRYGNATVDYKGAHIRAHSRHVATVLTVSGRIDSANLDHVADFAKKLVLADKPFVLDLSGVNSFTPQAIRLLCEMDDICSAVGVEWAVVASDAVNRRLRRDSDVVFPVVGSVAEAEHAFDDAILDRRRFLIPLLSKTA